jgi:peptidylprolyl isomerase
VPVADSVAPVRRPLTLALVPLFGLSLLACGGDDEDTTVESTPDETVVSDVELTPISDPDDLSADVVKPSVDIPAEIPTTLVVTELRPGDGPEAAAGDTVVVDYVGVRTEDGEEFDSSYESGPFLVTVGAGQVITGWDQGLVGVQTGQQLQLDIPNELAYGDQDTGDVIRAGDALTFVIDVRAVVPKPLPEDAPLDVTIEPSVDATEVTTTDAVEGDGDTIEAGDTVLAQVLIARGDNEKVIYSSWELGSTQKFVLLDGATFPGLVEGIPGMKLGGTRVIVMPPESFLGPEGNPQSGLPADPDVIMVVRAVGVV